MIKIDQGRKFINNNHHVAFHQGLEFLGKLLGFDTNRPSGKGDPDCIWYLSNHCYVVFEAKSEQNPNWVIGKGDIQEAVGRVQWVMNKYLLGSDDKVYALILSPSNKVEESGKEKYCSLRGSNKSYFSSLTGSI